MRQLDNGTLIPNGDEGLLYVTIKSNRTGEELTGTVSSFSGFSLYAARLFCQKMGYHVKEPGWGNLYKSASTYKYIPE